jgi:hypothetical protein
MTGPGALSLREIEVYVEFEKSLPNVGWDCLKGSDELVLCLEADKVGSAEWRRTLLCRSSALSYGWEGLLR